MKIESKKKYLIISGIILLIFLVVGVTYAWITWRSNNINISLNSDCFTINYTKGQNISGEELLLLDESEIISNNTITYRYGMAITNISAGINSSCNTSGKLIINLNVRDLPYAYTNLGDSTGALKYVITEYLSNDTFNILSSGSITTLGEREIYNVNLPTSGTNIELFVIFYIDGDLVSNDARETEFEATITGVAEQTPLPLATKITNLYSPTKTAVNNDITYNLDDNNKLMEDVGGNIRYYGADPNNYIYFNCETYPSTNCEVWRIIGVFDGKLKLIRGKNSNTSNKAPIGDLAWDQNKNINSTLTSYTNQWSDINLDNTSINNSSLQLLLNNEYYYGDTAGTVTYHNSSSSSIDLNMANIGIKNNQTRRMISESTWYLRAPSSTSIYPNVAYDSERVTGTVRTNYPTSWNGNIALAYPSDYGYAADLSQCKNITLGSYSDSICTSNNWMKGLFTSSLNWLLAPSASYSYYAWNVVSSGVVNNSNRIYNGCGVVPVLHLNSDVSIVSGDGSEGNPFKLSSQ